MATSPVGSTAQTNTQSSGSGKDAIDSLDTSAFIKMLVAELQNQDPMNPMSNSEMLQQVSQIRSIQSNDNLSTTLQSVLLGQNLATAGYMMGPHGQRPGGQRRQGDRPGEQRFHRGRRAETAHRRGHDEPGATWRKSCPYQSSTTDTSGTDSGT